MRRSSRPPTRPSARNLSPDNNLSHISQELKKSFLTQPCPSSLSVEQRTRLSLHSVTLWPNSRLRTLHLMTWRRRSSHWRELSPRLCLPAKSPHHTRHIRRKEVLIHDFLWHGLAHLVSGFIFITGFIKVTCNFWNLDTRCTGPVLRFLPILQA